jgi:cephalosporin-C deacetylase-like acetyl esterase
MIGLQGKLTDENRPPVKVNRTGTIQQEGYRIEKLYYESMPHLYVAANLYIPDGLRGPAPAILYVCGHALTQKHHYQAHARSFAERGFVCLIIETIQRGEVKGEHLGAESLGWFHWYSKGYNPAGVEVWNGIRGLDLLCQLPEVDKDRLGVTGISGGGSQSWYLPAADSRIKAAAAVAGASSLEGQIKQRTIDDHCDCMMPINTYGIDFSDIGALIAPRPFLIAQTTDDGYYSIEAVRTLHEKLKPVYALYNSPGHLSMVEAPGGHSYGTDGQFRSSVLSFFMKELMGKEIPPTGVGPIDISTKLSGDELRAYVNGPPEDDITTTIQDSFVAVAAPPAIKDRESLDTYRREVVGFLKAKTFASFPTTPTPLNIKLEFRTLDFSNAGREDYSFVPEQGWRLKFSLHRDQPKEITSPVLLVLVNPEEGRWDRYNLTAGLPNGFNVAYFEARGIGETGWSPSRQWHIRRAAAWTGRTVASMRVYDVLRCLEAIRSVPGVDPDNIGIVAQGEMAAIASYAALLDGRVRSLILKNPPPTQNAPGSRDGRGMALEMLNCLRVTDLPQVAGLFYPGEFIALGEQPDSFKWVEQLYKTLGSPGSYKHIQKLSEWTIKN